MEVADEHAGKANDELNITKKRVKSNKGLYCCLFTIIAIIILTIWGIFKGA